jgi:hypothetical protein
MLEITDDSGMPVTGSDGKPAVATISESAENASGGVSVTLTVGSFQFVGSQATSFGLVDPGILPGARGGCFTSDEIVVLKGGGGLQVSMSSAACRGGSLPGYNPGVDSNPMNGYGGLVGGFVTETGQPQEIDVLPSPIGSGSLHVIVDSIDAVPEPSTALLLAVGLGTLSAVRRRRAA